MTGRRAVIGLCLLSALVFSAVAAQGASALGTTGYTCVQKGTPGGAGFSKSHCKEEDAVSTGATYEHVAIGQGVETFLKGSNNLTGAEKSTAILKSTASGLEAEIKCLTVTGTGHMVNVISGTEMAATGNGTLLYTECSAPKPTGQECKVKESKISTEKLKATTLGQGMGLKFEPFEGTTFANVTLEGCKTAGLNIKYPVTGSLVGTPNGATTVTTETGVTTQNTLKFNGQKAGLEGSLTLSASPTETGTYQPLSVTTG